MSSTEESRHGLGVCEDCEAVQPVEVRSGEEIVAHGNPTCACGNNNFRLIE